RLRSLGGCFDPGGAGPKHRELAPTSPGVVLQPRRPRLRRGMASGAVARLAGRLVVGALRFKQMTWLLRVSRPPAAWGLEGRWDLSYCLRLRSKWLSYLY